MDSIKDIIPNVIKTLVEGRPATAKDIQEVWKNMLGESAPFTKVDDFQKGRLKIRVDSPARLFQLRLKKQAYCDQLKKDFPELVDIIFKVEKVD